MRSNWTPRSDRTILFSPSIYLACLFTFLFSRSLLPIKGNSSPCCHTIALQSNITPILRVHEYTIRPPVAPVPLRLLRCSVHAHGPNAYLHILQSTPVRKTVHVTRIRVQYLVFELHPSLAAPSPRRILKSIPRCPVVLKPKKVSRGGDVLKGFCTFDIMDEHRQYLWPELRGWRIRDNGDLG